MKQPDIETYSVEMKCRNCGAEFKEHINVGITVKDHFTNGTLHKDKNTCGNCKCCPL